MQSRLERWAPLTGVGYLVLYFMGVPIGLILLLWVIFGNNLLTPG